MMRTATVVDEAVLLVALDAWDLVMLDIRVPIVQWVNSFFFVKVCLTAQTLRTPSLTQLGYELMTSRS